VIRELAFKPDFARTVERFAAWWQGAIIDRPPVTLWVPGRAHHRGPVSQHKSLRQRWLDVDFQVESAIAGLECGNFIGDTLPVFNPNVGPEVTATLYGAELEFGEGTSWSKPIVHDIAQWDEILKRAPDFGNLYWQTIEKITTLALERSHGRYLVGLTDLHGTFDILAGLREPELLCMDIVDAPEKLAAVCHHVAQGFVAAFDRQWAQLQAAGQGSISWMATYHEGPSYVPSCDFWCMLDGAFSRRVILPDILLEMSHLERSIFHLDGEGALRHLDMLLEIPQLNAIQWVYGTGHGPAAKWIDVYKRIQAAGKSSQVCCENSADALAVLDAVGPKGLWFTIDKGFESVAAGEEFLRQIERSSAGRR
jgi:hypothetical protein